MFDGAPVPGAIEDLRGPLVSSIGALAHELPRAFGEQTVGFAHQDLLADGSQALAIMGERGSGKTTLLTSVCGDLEREHRHLVLPIMRPELFGAADSIIVTFLAELWETITREAEENETAGVGDGGATVRLLEKAARSFAVGQTTPAAIERASESPTDFAEDLLQVSRSRVRLTRQLRAVVRNVCLPEGAPQPRVIIVPVDDPDLGRIPIPDILTDLQILGAIPGVVPIACFSRSDLRNAWMGNRRFEGEDSEDSNFLLARQLEKVFPYRCRFELEPIAEGARASFQPVGEGVTLAEKLILLHQRVVDRTRALWMVDPAFMVGAADLELPSPLPDNARTLVQLWESLDVATVEGDVESLYLTIRRVLDILTERWTGASGTTGDRAVHIGPARTTSDGKPVPTIGQIPANLDVRVGGRFVPAAPAVASIQLAPIKYVLGVPPGQERDRRIKPQALVQILSMQEFVFGSGLYDVQHLARVAWLGNEDWSKLQRVELGGRSTDNTFILLPDAVTFSEVVRAASLWNELARFSEHCTAEQLLSACIRASCLTADPAAPPIAQDGDYDAALATAVELFKKAASKPGSTAAAFVEWFACDLPFQWHAGFFSSDTIREMAKQHSALIDGLDLPRYGAPAPKDTFDSRLKRILDARDPQEDDRAYGWVGGYFDLAAAKESVHLVELGEIHRSWHRDVTGIRAGASASGLVNRTQRAGGRSALSPYERPEGTMLLAAAMKALDHARSGKIRPRT